jgi:hypothetical protein
MSDHAANEVLPANLSDHRAAKAWRQLQPACPAPQQIEILKLKTKSAVYRLAGVGPGGSAVVAKRCRGPTAAVERSIYDEFLAGLPLPVLCCYGFVPEPASDFGWLFVQDAGRHAYSPASGEHRALAGRWLATIHRAQVSPDFQARLPDRSPAHYLQSLRSARTAVLEHVDNPVLFADEAALLRRAVAQCDLIEAHWEELENFFEGCPRTLVHGDFVIKNLRLRNGAADPALLVYDWEMAGWGVPATDLAQSLGRCASPDLETYCSGLNQETSMKSKARNPKSSPSDVGRPASDFRVQASNFGLATVRDLRRLADYGNLLRLVDKIFWDTVGIGGNAREFLLRPVLALNNYEPQLDAALRVLDWKSPIAKARSLRSGICGADHGATRNFRPELLASRPDWRPHD